MAPLAPPVPRHIALIGFMGAGKSTVGQRIATRLGLPFFDLDDCIEQDAQKPIAQIFRERGETAFRAHERAVLRHLLERDEPIVLATGGGTYVDPAMRQMVQEASCAIIHLKVDAQNVLERLKKAQAFSQRPLLDGPDPDTAVYRLLEARASAYADGSVTIDTDNTSIETVCEQVVEALMAGPTPDVQASEAPKQTNTGAALSAQEPIAAHALGPLRLNTPISLAPPKPGRGASTTVLMRLRSGSWLCEAICQACKSAERIMVVTDTNVAAVHLAPLVQGLLTLGKEVTTHVIEPGEQSKSLAGCEALYTALSQAQLGRKDAMVALGGGVVGDLTGFAASTYLRGLAYVQVPTTTLSAVDSSVGAKTALNTAAGKNQIGSFYAPVAVLIAVSHLMSQSRRHNAAGIVEAIKMGATHDAQLVHAITRRAPQLLAMSQEALADIIGRAIGIKAAVVAQDMRDEGSRAALNFGHTFGHAIEIGENYRLLHGEAIALGMMAEIAWAQSQGLCRDVAKPIKAALLAMNMPVDWRHVTLNIDALQCDKKRLGAQIVLPIVPELGCAKLHKADLDKLVAYVTDGSQP